MKQRELRSGKSFLKINDQHRVNVFAPNRSAAKKIVKLAAKRGIVKSVHAITIHIEDSNVIDLYAGENLKKFLKVAKPRKKSRLDVIEGGRAKDAILAKLSEPVSAAGVILFSLDTKRFLFGRRTKPPYLGQLACFAGKLEKDETPEEAAIRELREEAHLGVDRESLIRLLGYRDSEVQFFPYLVIIRREITPKLNDEFSEALWVDADKAISPDLNPGLRVIFRHDPILSKIISAAKRKVAYDWESLVNQIITGDD